MIVTLLRRFFFLVFLGALAGSMLSGQTGRTPVQVSFLLISGAKPTDKAFMLGAQGATVPVRFSMSTKSALIPYVGSSPLVIYVADDQVPSGRKPIASVPLPSGAGRVLVLLAPSGDSAPGAPVYRGVAVEDDVAKMPPGSVRFINYSGKTVAVNASGNSGELANAGIKVVPLSAGTSEVQVQVATLEGEAYQVSFDAKIKFGRGERRSYIILPTNRPSGRGVAVVASRDVISPPPAP